MRSNRGKKSGFTLVELLIVIAIVGVLVALSITGLNLFRKRAQQSGALSNLRSLAASAASYGGDHDGNVPPYRSTEFTGAAVYWFCWLPSYYGTSAARTMKTPGDDLKQANNPSLLRGPETDLVTGRRDIFWSYARNMELPKARTANFNDGTVRSHRMPQPARTMLFIETRQNGAMYTSYPDSNFNFDPQGRTVAAFLDGHVELVPRDAIIDVPNTPEAREKYALFWFGYPDASSRRDY